MKQRVLKILWNSIFAVVTAVLLAFFIWANGTADRAEAEINDPEYGADASEDPSDDEISPQDTGKECTCTTKCTEDDVDGNCEVCSTSYLYCEAENTSIDYVATISYTIDEVDKVKKYASLEAAFNDIDEITDLVREQEADFVPVIKLGIDSTVTSDIEVPSGYDIKLDFNGFLVTLSDSHYINLGSGTAVLTDSRASAINFEDGVDNIRPGGVTGEGDALFLSTGNVNIEKGYYRVKNGAIVKNAANTFFDNAYLFASGGNLAFGVANITIGENGFYLYDSVSSSGDSNINLSEGMSLVKSRMTLNGNAVEGYRVKASLFKSTIEQFGEDNSSNPVYYYSSFEDAFSDAMSRSISGDGVKAVIEISDSTYSGVNLTKGYTLNALEGEYTPSVEIKNMTIQRGATNDVGFDDTLFTVSAGNLIFTDCTVDGYMSESELSKASMIVVSSGASLTLKGSDGKGTNVIKNTVLKGISETDPGAGILVKSGGTVHMSGLITVKNNQLYEDATNESDSVKIPSNMYIENGGVVVLDGPMTHAENKVIGVNYGTKLIEDGKIFGTLSDEYAARLDGTNAKSLDLTAFGIDGVASFGLKYNPDNHSIYWQKQSNYLPEAGVLRIEYIILLIGLLGFISRNITRIKENPAVLSYVTVVSVVCMVLGAALGFINIRAEKLLVEKNDEIAAEIIGDINAKQEELEKADKQKKKKDTTNEEAKMVVLNENAITLPQDGREYIGIIEIPSLNITLPVLSAYTDADMKTTPCVYNGCRENNDLIIVGHNYDSQFGEFNSLSKGDKLNAKLTLANGETFEYESILIENLNPDQIDEMVEGNWDMTLFTCNYAGDKRITIRFNLVR